MNDRRIALRFLGFFGAVWLPLLVTSLRFQAPEFRPWEMLAETSASRFVPNRKLEMLELGDLEAWSWVRTLQTPAPTTFSTDRFGRRNPELETPPRIVVVGDSYVGGSGLSDADTLSARMSVKLGEPVYNFAFSSSRIPALFLADPRFAARPPEVVVFAPNQRNLSPLLLTPPRLPPRAPLDERLQVQVARIELSSKLTRFARYALNGVLFELLGNDDLAALPDGTPVLRLSLNAQRLQLPARLRRFDQVGLAVAVFGRQLAQRGTRLLFAPIPDAGNIYPELYPEPLRATIVKPSLIGLVVAETRARGIDVVDLPRLFRANKWPYLYRLDDSHWNERAVELTADALTAAVRSLQLGARAAATTAH